MRRRWLTRPSPCATLLGAFLDRAKQQVEPARQRLADIEAQLEREVTRITEGFDPLSENLQEVPVRRKKTGHRASLGFYTTTRDSNTRCPLNRKG